MFANPQNHYVSTLDETPMTGVEFQVPSLSTSTKRGYKRKANIDQNEEMESSPKKRVRSVLKAKKKRGKRTSKTTVDVNRLANMLKIQQKLGNHKKAKAKKRTKKKKSTTKKKSRGKKSKKCKTKKCKTAAKKLTSQKRLAKKLNKAIIKQKLSNHQRVKKKKKTQSVSFPDLLQ